MSRGIGELQRDILSAMRHHRGVIAFDELKETYPRLARTHSLHRSVRTLKRRELLREVRVQKPKGYGRRWLAMTTPKTKPFGRTRADKGLLALASQAHRGLTMTAAARGVGQPQQAADLKDSLDAYRRMGSTG